MAVCPCGKLLHYPDLQLESFVQQAIERLGPTTPVSTAAGTWLVPRHFHALHGVTAAELPRLAKRYRWEQERGPYDQHRAASESRRKRLDHGHRGRRRASAAGAGQNVQGQERRLRAGVDAGNR